MKCGRFMDPLIEHPPLLLLLDLVLLKPRVYLHLLFNRGHPPKDGRPEAQVAQSPPDDTLPGIWLDWTRLFMVAVLAESASRLVTRSDTSQLSGCGTLVTVLMVFVEVLAQHIITTLAALAVLRLRGWWKKESTDGVIDGRQKHFK